MPSAIIDGIATRYEIVGSGPPLLMYAPGDFNAVVEAWSTLGIYQKLKLVDHLPAHFTCILFDRRECGQSGGRVESITWEARCRFCRCLCSAGSATLHRDLRRHARRVVRPRYCAGRGSRRADARRRSGFHRPRPRCRTCHLGGAVPECLPQSTYWDAAVEAQTEAATNPRLLEFLRGVQL